MLKSYEQMGVLRLECIRGCACEPLLVDLLRPETRFATLDAARTGRISRSRRCAVAFTNVSPRPVPGQEPRTKLKLVSLAVLRERANATVA